MADRDSILSKLEALMKRTRENGASEAEVEAAMSVARKLMDQHNIAMEEVLLQQRQSEAPSSIEIKEEQVRTASKMDRFEKYLMHTAAAICDVKWYYSKSRFYEGGKLKNQVKLVFYGMEHDVLAAKLLFLELIVVVRAMARAKVGPRWEQRHYWYCDGFCSGLMSKANALKAKSNQAATSGTALILVKDQAIAKYAEDVLKVKTSEDRGMSRDRMTSSEFNTGYRDGSSYDLNPKREKQVNHKLKNLN